MAVTDIGKVAYLNKGAYSSETNYEINDVVTYEGSSYVSKGNNNQGNLPTNTTYWDLVAQKGANGEPGQDGHTPVKGVDYFTQQDIESLNIPRKTSDLTNDSNFITKNVDDLTYYYTKTEVDSKVASVYKYKGSVATYQDLPSTGLTIGDVYNVESDGSNYAWTGTEWDALSGFVDLSGYQEKIDSSHKLNADLVDDTNSTNKFFSGDYNDLINKPVINDEIYYETTGQNTNNPFIFDGCKKGIHYFNYPYDKGTLYYKTTSTDTVKTYSGQISYMQFFKNVDFNTLEEDEEFGYVVCVNSGNSQSTNGSLNKQSIKKASTPFYGSSINLYKTITSKNQSFSGVKTFQSIPKQNDTTAPTQDEEFTNKKYVDDSIAKYGTMPTASADILGKIVQYIGTTDSTYTKGHFYECVSDGGSPAVYSWKEINFINEDIMPITLLRLSGTIFTNAMYGASDRAIALNITNLNATVNKNYLKDAINKQIKNNIKTMRYLLYDGSYRYGNSYFEITLPSTSDGTRNTTVHTDMDTVIVRSMSGLENTRKRYNQYIEGNRYLSLTFANGLVSDLSWSTSTTNFSKINILDVTNEIEWTPTHDYNPVHKKYVDDKPTTYTGYDATKTQILKNVQGVLTWVDE